MSSVGSVVQAFHAVVSSGATISQQTSFVSEVKDKLEELITTNESIKATVELEISLQQSVTEYFEGFVGFLASQEAPHDIQDGIISANNELIEQTQANVSVLETLIAQLMGAMEMCDSVNEILSATATKADEVAGIIDASTKSQ